MKRIRSLLLLLVCTAAMGLCGCDYVELTEEESKRIAEYMAGKLLEYDRYYEEKLVKETDGQLAEELEETTKPEEMPSPEPEETVKPEETLSPEPEETAKPEETSPQPVETTTPEEKKLSCEDFFKKAGMKLSYKKSDLHQSYPDDEKNMDFVVEAEKGKKLLVVHMSLTNISGEAKSFSMLQKEVSFTLRQKDGTELRPLMTFLVQDLQYFEADFEKGETCQTVLLFSVDENAGHKGAKLILESGKKQAEINL